jgi:hypothetical protein
LGQAIPTDPVCAAGRARGRMQTDIAKGTSRICAAMRNGVVHRMADTVTWHAGKSPRQRGWRGCTPKNAPSPK